MGNTQFVRWQFVQLDAGSGWTWRQLGFDGSIVAMSESIADYGHCVINAIKHGFKPTIHDWTIIKPHCVTHFKAGTGALTIPGDTSQVPKPRPGKRFPNVSELLNRIGSKKKTPSS